MKQITMILTIIFSITCLSGFTWAKWVQDGESLNVEPNKNAMLAGIIAFDSKLYVTWLEGNTHSAWSERTRDLKIYVKQWDGKKWTQYGTSVNNKTTPGVNIPSINIFQNTPYIAWHGINNIGYIRYYKNNRWVNAGKPIPLIKNPRLINLDNNPQIMVQQNFGISSYRLEMNDWHQIGNLLMTKQIHYYPAWTFSFKGNLYGAWIELSSDEKYRLWVKNYKENNGDYFGGPAFEFSAMPYSIPGLIVANETPYVAMDNGKQIFVKHFENDQWVQDGSPIDGIGPVLFHINGNLNLAWTADKIYFAYFTGKDWKWNGQTLEGYNPAIAVINNTLYFAYQRDDETGVSNVYLSHWEADPVKLPQAQPAETPISIPDSRDSAHIKNPIIPNLEQMCMRLADGRRR